ncbi:MAG: hypothetical protein DHS20C18_20660 [Saprospiraceae bacterium]|nr:MAG: hypothetical protein DHS20C18_20660 [Saprospiraceae bacterium]
MKRIGLVLSVLLTLVSCRKDKDSFHVEEEIIIGSSAWTGRIGNFYSEVMSSEEHYNFDAAFAATFRTEQQTEFHFSPFSYATEAGVIVDGDIDIDVLQLKNKGDLILHNISTMVDGQLLEFLSAYSFSAKKGNLPLALAPNQNIQFTFPDSETFDTGVNVLLGEEHVDGVSLSWADTLNIAPQVLPSEIFDESEGVWKPAYSAESPQLGWFGCGRLVDYPTGTTSICVNLPEGFNDINSAVFLAFDDYWSVIKLEGSSIEKQFCADEIPIGAPIKIISISERESGYFYLDFKDFTPAEGIENNVNLYPEATPLNEMMVWIQSI